MNGKDWAIAILAFMIPVAFLGGFWLGRVVDTMPGW